MMIQAQATQTYRLQHSAEVLDRVEFQEVRNAAAVLAAVHPIECEEIVEYLDWLIRATDDAELKKALSRREWLRRLGWRKATHRVVNSAALVLEPRGGVYEDIASVTKTTVEEYEDHIDNYKQGVAFYVFRRVGDTAYKRCLTACAHLHSWNAIDVAVMVVPALGIDDVGRTGAMVHVQMRNLGIPLLRGDAGGCPVLVAALKDRT